MTVDQPQHEQPPPTNQPVGEDPSKSESASSMPREPVDASPPRIKIGSQRYERAAPPIASGLSAATMPDAEVAEPRAEPPSEPSPAKTFPPTNLRKRPTPDEDAELAAAMAGASLDELFADDASVPLVSEIELDSRRRARVLRTGREYVFVELGGPHQGIVPLRQFTAPPEPGSFVDVIVGVFDADEGLYALSVPGAAAEVADWSQLAEGVIVEARVTGHNQGGLECEVHRIRGFIPAGQVDRFRVDDLAQFVGEKFTCLVTEANEESGNLVLSRRAILEREAAEAQKKLREELAAGQIREGLVRGVRDFGAFVDLGGIDGLLHVSQIAWARIQHPSEVLHEGQKVRVKILAVHPETGKISLGMKDLVESPWATAAQKYAAKSRVRGRVTKLMEFGAFVQLEPGIEGLVHISELSHRRVFRTRDVVAEGQEVDAQVLSVDAEAQRISLSMKALEQKGVSVAEPEQAEDLDAPPSEPSDRPSPPLRGGRSSASGGEKFGLQW